MEEFESSATVIRVFESQSIPDILQTEEYARSEVRLSGATPAAAERLVRARLKRQKHLGRNKQIVLVLTEGALRARLCSLPEMVGQIETIKSFAKEKSSRFGVIPWHARLLVPTPPPLQIYDDTLACVGLPHGQVCLTRQKDIQLYLRRFEALEKTAVVGNEAGSVLDRIIQDLRRLDDLERAVNVPPV